MARGIAAVAASAEDGGGATASDKRQQRQATAAMAAAAGEQHSVCTAIAPILGLTPPFFYRALCNSTRQQHTHWPFHSRHGRHAHRIIFIRWSSSLLGVTVAAAAGRSRRLGRPSQRVTRRVPFFPLRFCSSIPPSLIARHGLSVLGGAGGAAARLVPPSRIRRVRHHGPHDDDTRTTPRRRSERG